MTKKLACSLLCVATIALVSLTALAADDHGVTLSHDGRTAIAAKVASHVTPAERELKLTTIASNLSDFPFGIFFCCYGSTITGPSSSLGWENWDAIPFTPTANLTVTKLETSVGYIINTDTNLELAVYSDASGAPNKPLKIFNVSATSQFGACCTLLTAKSATGVPVTANTQYWLVVRTNDKKHPTFFGAWAFNSTDMRGHTTAYWCKTTGTQCGNANGKWQVFTTSLQPAYGVFGH